MFIKILKAIENHYVSTIPEIAQATGVNEEIVKIAINYWRKKGKINFQSADDAYSANDCSTCPLRNNCYIWKKKKKKRKKEEKNDFITYRKR